MVTVVINIMEGGRRKEKFVYDQSSLHSYTLVTGLGQGGS